MHGIRKPKRERAGKNRGKHRYGQKENVGSNKNVLGKFPQECTRSWMCELERGGDVELGRLSKKVVLLARRKAARKVILTPGFSLSAS